MKFTNHKNVTQQGKKVKLWAEIQALLWKVYIYLFQKYLILISLEIIQKLWPASGVIYVTLHWPVFAPSQSHKDY